MKPLSRPLIAAWISLVFLAQVVAANAQNAWTGAAGTTNWSTPGNWAFGVAPTSGDTVVFNNDYPGAAAGVVDNIVDALTTIYALEYTTTTTNGYHTTLINQGMKLQVEGFAPDAIYLGYKAPLNTEDLQYRVVGAGTLTVTNTSGKITAVQTGANQDHLAILDFSGLTNFQANVGQILVGAQTFSTGLIRPMGTMYLAETNFIRTEAGTAKPGILVAAFPGSDTNVRGTQQLFLGQHNVISADVISMGGHKSTGQILFRSGVTDGYAQIRGSAGGSDKVKLMTIGDNRARIDDLTGGGTGVAATGTFNAARGFLDLSIVDLMIGRSQTNGNGVSTGTMTIEQGSIEADNLYIGYHPSPAAQGSGNAFNGVGTLNLNGPATLTVNNDIQLAVKAGTNIPVATVNVAAGAVVNAKGNITTSGGTSTLNNSGLLNLQPTGDPTPGSVTVSTLSGSGAITNATTITVNSALTPGTAASAGTLSLSGNLALPATASLNMNLAEAATIGSGVNDLISVTGDLALNNNVLNLVPLGASPAVGSYRLINYTGNRTGTLNFVNPTRYDLAVAYPANQVNLDVLGGSAGNLRWNSLSSAAWDITTSNWFNTGASAADKFLQLDTVTIDDSGTYTNLLLLSGALFPNTVTVSSSTRDYSFGGSGRISGAASVVKQGTSTLTISNANDFTGPVTVAAGILRLANTTALGSTNSGTTVLPGATLDIQGISIYNPGELITISGTGLNNTGAVINTGAGQNNAIRFLSLADDALVRTPSRWDVRGPGGNGSFSAQLDLNGKTLTKFGAAQMSIVDAVATNAGSIVLGEGILGLTRSVIDGAGAIYSGTNVVYIENSTTGHVAKPMIFEGGTLRVTGGAFALGSPVTNLSGLTVEVTGTTLTLTNSVVGAGTLTKSSTGTLVIDGPKTYTGPTTITGGTVVLTNGASLAATPEILVGAGALLNANGLPGGLALTGGQVLSGNGSVVGDVSAANGAGLAPGISAGTLTLSNNVALNNSTNVFELGLDPATIGGGVNDLVVIEGNLTLTGVNAIKLLPLAGLTPGVPYTILQYKGSLSGGLANLTVSSDSPRYVFTLLDPATTPGSIQVTAVGTAVNLVWKGGAPANPTRWDTQTTANWLNGLLTEVFYTGDSVTLDNTATTGTVSLFETVKPAVVTVNNGSLAYSLTGSGTLEAGSLNKSGTGSLSISNDGANTIGAATINAGTVRLENSAGNTFAGLTTVNGGTLTVAEGPNSFPAGARILAGTMNIQAPLQPTFGQPLLVNGGSLVFNQEPDLGFATVIADEGTTSGTLQKLGTNMLTLSGNNTNFNGPITVSAGTLRVGQTYALGSAVAGTTVANGATLDINGTSIYNPGDEITIAGTGTTGQGAIVNSGAAQQNAIRAITLNNNATIGAPGNRWDIRGPGGSGSYSGALNLNNFTLNKIGAGQISIVDANVLDPGTINIFSSVLHFTRCQVDGAGAVNLYTNTLVFENSTAGYFRKTITSAGGTLRATGNALTIESPITTAGLTVDTAVALTLSGNITGPGGLTKINTAMLTLQGMNTFAGLLTVNAGVLQLGTGDSGGNAGIQIINTTGTTAGTGPVVDLPASVMTPATLPLTIYTTNSPDIRGSLRASGFGAQWYGPIIPSGDGRVGFYADALGSELNLYGPVTNSAFAGRTFFRGGNGTGYIHNRMDLGAGDFYKTDGGTWVLMTNGHKWSLSTIAVGRVRIEIDNGLNPDVRLVMGQSGNNTAGLDLNGYNQTVSGLSSTGNDTSTLQIGNDSFIKNSILTVTGTNVTSYRGQLVDVLTESNPYKLGLTVSSAGLYLNSPSNTYTLPTTVQAGGTLGGAGVLVSPVTVQSGGTLAPGAVNAVGTLTISNTLSFSAGSTNLAQLDPVTLTADLVEGLTQVSYAGTLVLTNVSGTLYPAGATFKLFNANSYSGTFAAIVPDKPSPTQTWDTSLLAIDGTIKVLGSPTPTTPTNIGFSVTGSTLEISWPTEYTGWRLESQTNSLSIGLSNNWFPVPGSTETNRMFLQIDSTKGTVYFRLGYTP